MTRTEELDAESTNMSSAYLDVLERTVVQVS
jgi:hypothetical protein